MKRWMLGVVLICALLFIAILLVVVFRFVSIADDFGGTPSAPSLSSDSQLIAEYVSDKWQSFSVEYDSASQTLSLGMTASLTYEQACAYGGSVYEQETAPATYTDQLRLIAADLSDNFDVSAITVVLTCQSTDEKPIFSVDNSGAVWTCWEEG